MTTENQGYLEAPYLNQAYLADTTIRTPGLQFTKVVTGNVHSISLSWEMNITKSREPGLQYNAKLVDQLKSASLQFKRFIAGNVRSVPLSWSQQSGMTKTAGVQVSRYIVNQLTGESVQFTKLITTGDSFGVSFQRFMVDKSKSIGLQFARYVENRQRLSAIEFRAGKLRHETSTVHGYLSDAYLFDPYLAPYMQVSLSSQYRAFITNSETTGLQFRGQVADVTISRGLSFRRKIADVVHSIGLSFEALQGKLFGLQFTQAIYNTTNLRILSDFPSRGLDGLNWVTNSQAPGDFSVNNLNTDIIEQTFRAESGFKSGLVISSDTGIPQGAFVDTLAILNHNFTTSASIVLQGSQSSDFSSTVFSQTLFVIKDNKNIYWISPALPTESYRYWRFLVNDPTNQNDYLEVGTILYGSSLIMTEESFTDQVRRRTIHFSDKVRTEGYTNVSNDRAIKFTVALTFKNLNYGKGNYRKLVGIFETARTSLKCLWIPTPKNPERFAVFGKLTEIPEEEHNYVSADADYIDFSIEVDESL